MFRRTRQSGFTLVELMIVVVIIGILAAMALPRFMQSTAKTKQSEAKMIIKQIYVNMRAFRQQSPTNSYFVAGGPASAATPNAFNQIWVEIAPEAKYTYTINTAGDLFEVWAEGNIDDDPALDTWVIDEEGIVQNTINDVTAE